MALNELLVQQSKPTANTEREITQFLNYCATHSEARMKYHSINMILYINSDAGYLNCQKSRSRAVAHLFFSNKKLETEKIPKEVQPNGPIHLECNRIKSSALT